MINIVLKEPVQVNGLRFVRPYKQFEENLVFSLGEEPFQPSYRVEKDRPRKKQGDNAVIQLEFDPRTVRWVQLHPKNWNPNQSWINFSLELTSPDPKYANGVFRTLGQINKDMRNVLKFFVRQQLKYENDSF